MISTAEFNPILELDLDPIKVKLMHKESGEGWSLEYANAREFEYRRFLYLMKMFPEEQTAPLFDVDIFWHYHILDTMKYAADCEQIFGYFLHHFPYIGLRGEDDEAAHHRIGVRMQELYEATFGESYLQHATTDAPTLTSGAAVETAWSSATGKTAWSSATAKTAWSSATAKTAWSSATAKTAWSSATAKTAWSSATAKTAWSSATAKTAWSSATSVSGPTDQAGTARARQFYSERPTLSAAA
ncbi:MAG: glycine-rich domain-containing protein-like [Pseudomonadota bacterium]|nr:glycine-rich domain-containing protein-like [Pseudomonadota bacterium]